MKNTVIALCIVGLSICCTETTQAQGLLGRLKDKISNSAGESNSGKPNLVPKESILKAGKEDMESKVLDALPFDKVDPLGLNGLYYLTQPIYSLVRGDVYEKEFKTIQKLHINYFEEGKNINYVANSRFSLDEEKDPYFEPLKFYSEVLSNKINKQAGMLKISPYPSTYNYSYVGARVGGGVSEKSGKYICDLAPVAEKQKIKSNMGFYVYEPGIVVMMDDKYYSLVYMAKEPCFEEFKKTYTPIILYKKEYEARALAITKEEIHKRLTEWNVKYNIALDKGDVGMDLIPSCALGTAPAFATPRAQIINSMKSYLASTNESFFVPDYAYVATGIADTYDLFANRSFANGLANVKVGHAVTFYVVCKNLKPELGNTYKTSASKYVMFQVQLYEDVRGAEYNTNNYTGKWYIGTCSPPYGLSADENPMKYKGK